MSERRVSLRKRGVAAMYDINDRIDELHKKQKVPRLKCRQGQIIHGEAGCIAYYTYYIILCINTYYFNTARPLL